MDNRVPVALSDITLLAYKRQVFFQLPNLYLHPGLQSQVQLCMLPCTWLFLSSTWPLIALLPPAPLLQGCSTDPSSCWGPWQCPPFCTNLCFFWIFSLCFPARGNRLGRTQASVLSLCLSVSPDVASPQHPTHYCVKECFSSFLSFKHLFLAWRKIYSQMLLLYPEESVSIKT